MKRVLNFLIFGIIILSFKAAAQEYPPDKAVKKITSRGNLTFPAWSEDGRYLFYQTDENGNSDIFGYDIENDSTFPVAVSPANETHPAWWNKHHSVAYEIEKEGRLFIYRYHMLKKRTTPLFRRTIACRHPSFDPDGRLVTFSGYDRETRRWQVFTYDFVYDNLNRLTKDNTEKVFPVFSPKGNKIIFQTLEMTGDTTGSLHLINWYGNKMHDFNGNYLLKTAFTPDDWRIVYVITGGKGEQLQSMRKDGTSIFKLSPVLPAICCPAFSPDGKRIAVSIKRNGKFEIFIFNTVE